MSVMLEPVFLFLAQEYRVRPGHGAALALYDVFCDPGAPARIKAPDALPPRDLKLSSAVQMIRRQWKQMLSAEPPAEGNGIPITVPQRHLFDSVAQACRDDPSGSYTRVARSYNPELTPEQNLAGGRMTEGQRQFVEFVWKPRVRPRLIAAGFWRIADIE